MGIHEKKLQVDTANLDFSKAFEKVPHSEPLSWLDTYIMDQNNLTLNLDLPGVEDAEGGCRWQIIITKVESGVIQGAVPGPILFHCHTNDLPASVNSTV